MSFIRVSIAPVLTDDFEIEARDFPIGENFVATLQQVTEYTLGHVNTEGEETRAHPLDVFKAFADFYFGLASGRDFAFVFAGDVYTIESHQKGH